MVTPVRFTCRARSVVGGGVFAVPEDLQSGITRHPETTTGF